MQELFEKFIIYSLATAFAVPILFYIGTVVQLTVNVLDSPALGG